MEIIKHRVNSIELLKSTNTDFGVEVDIRSIDGGCYIHHDPFNPGVRFEEWLEHYKHGTLILNVKEEGLEQHLLDLMEKFSLENFFFLDQSIPFIVKWAKQGELRCAVRISEYEPVALALNFSSMVKWAWVDHFTRFPLTAESAHLITGQGVHLCIVSPELHGEDQVVHIQSLQTTLLEQNIEVRAVCTKKPELWANFE